MALWLLMVSGLANAGSFDQTLWALRLDRLEEWFSSPPLHGLSDVHLWVDRRLDVTPPLGYQLTDRLGSFIKGTWDGAHMISPAVGNILSSGALYSNGFDNAKASQQMGVAFGFSLRF